MKTKNHAEFKLKCNEIKKEYGDAEQVNWNVLMRIEILLFRRFSMLMMEFVGITSLTVNNTNNKKKFME